MAQVYDSRRPRLPVGLAEAVDAKRGQVPFNRWIVEALEKALGTSGEQPAGDLPRRESGPPASPRASEKEIAPVDPVLKDPPGDLPKIARRHWA